MTQDSHFQEPESMGTPRSEAPEEIIQAARPSAPTPSRWNKPELPVVGRNSLPRPPRRRTKPPESETDIPTAGGAEAKPLRPRESLLSKAKETDSVRPDSLISGISSSDRLPESGGSHEKSVSFTETSLFPDPIIVEDAPSYREARHGTMSPASTDSPDRRKQIPIGAICCGAALLLLAGYVVPKGGLQSKSLSGTSVAVSNEGVPRQPGLPDPSLTPGDAASARTLPSNAEALAAAPPEISVQVRDKVLRSYGVPPDAANRQVVTYLIPPSLNGTDRSINIFPTTPWFANLKRRLDRELTQKVADGKITLTNAQAELKTNWIDSAHRHYVRNYGENAADRARSIENNLNWISGSKNSTNGKGITSGTDPTVGTDRAK